MGAALVAASGCGFNSTAPGETISLGETESTSGPGTVSAATQGPSVTGSAASTAQPTTEAGTEAGPGGSTQPDPGTSGTLSETGTPTSGDTSSSPWAAARPLSLRVDGLDLDDELTDVPIAVHLNSDRIDYDIMRAQGQDLRFRDADNNDLPYEIERWEAGGESHVWVLVPHIDPDAGAELLMLYGNDAADDEQDALALWSNGYYAVWHFVDNCSGPLNEVRDSTGNDLHGTCVELSNADTVDGLVGDALSFEADNERVAVALGEELPITDELSVEAIFFMEEAEIEQEQSRFLARQRDVLELHATRGGGGGSHGPRFGARVDGGWETAATNTLAAGWRSVTGTGAEGDEVVLYVDGRRIAAHDWPEDAVFDLNTEAFQLGHDFRGLLDEVRLSTVERNADWVAVQHASALDALLTFGDETAP